MFYYLLVFKLQAIAFREMQSLRSMAFNPMKAHLEELTIRNQQLQDEVFSLKAVSASTLPADTSSLLQEVSNLRSEVAVLKQRGQERDKLFEDSLSYTQGLEKENDSLKVQNGDLEAAFRSLNEKCSHLEEGHKREMERSTEAGYKRGHSKGHRDGFVEGYRQGKAVGVHRCRTHLLMTPAGQAFLSILTKDIPEAHLHSQAFWDRM